MNNLSFMHQNEMDFKLKRFNEAINKLQGIQKKKINKNLEIQQTAKYSVIESFEIVCEKEIKQQEIIDYGLRHYLKGRIHVEKELWIVASIKNLMDYGYLKVEE
ncbi:hypothetical protein [Listeria riparia]|uniref:Uncharacterized protein n=1 Tax=Listeria riparia FSL S10-1204 TaxID=1265816 RepID=W7DCI8_9LIST|nr:hypothetical protein [Listeria riparia]EUJ43033.1 hypothetical protein PRIP_14558 [Listeria riparia FSL S10-1204]